MTNRELLTMAAKAAGLTLRWGEVYIVGDDEVDCTDVPYVVSGQPDEADWHWNPLTDDGDALRLAVRLNLKHVFHPALNQAIVRPYYASDLEWVENVEKHPDPYAATRRAIVRAAAAIGEQA